MTSDAHRAHEADHLLGTARERGITLAELLHDGGRDVVAAYLETLAHGQGAAPVLRRVGGPRRPFPAVGEHERYGIVHELLVGRHAAEDARGVKEGLDGRTDLAAALPDVVELEVAVVRAADIGLDVARGGLDGHESGAEDGLVVTDGIIRCHSRIHRRRLAVLVPGEDLHLLGLGELLHDLGVGDTSVLLQAVAVAPAPCLLHQAVARGLVYVVGERLVGEIARLAVEAVLEGLAEVLLDRLLGILLHLVVNRGIDAQAVTVKVVRLAVGFLVLGQPAVQLVLDPPQRIGGKLLAVAV